MRVYTTQIRSWYVYFTAGFFVVAALLTGLLPPLAVFNSSNNSTYKPIFQGNPNQPKVAFACNVFWGEEFLPSMLDTLSDNNVKITFFVGGSWAKRYPNVLAILSEKGHELGNHSYTHPHPNRINKAKNQEEILKTETLIKEITNIKTTLYAPPYGEYNDNVLNAAGELSYKTIMWSIDTIDWQRPNSEIIKNRVMKKLHPGAIILMHPTAPTAKVLPELIREIKAKGYTICTVSEVIQ